MLVDRHGTLVRGVCLRVLGNHHDADDAFQATFLVLVRKARSIRRLGSVGAWLHGVAQRIAQKMRLSASRRRGHEKLAAGVRPAPARDDHGLGELHTILDEELDRLPAQYRQPLILCCLQGKSRDEVAQELGWSVGAVKGRLERGREALRQRLVGRGVTLPAALAGLTLVHGAAVPPALAATTTAAALQYSAGQVLAWLGSARASTIAGTYLHGVLLAKLKLAAVAALVGLSLLGAGWGLAYQLGPPGSHDSGAETLLASPETAQPGKQDAAPALPPAVKVVQEAPVGKKQEAPKHRFLVGRTEGQGSAPAKGAASDGRRTAGNRALLGVYSGKGGTTLGVRQRPTTGKRAFATITISDADKKAP
jgi:RNA polymerase sigma factor (sigma-70 family)